MIRAITTALALTLPVIATAQAAWPEKPIKVVVPFKAGGTSDQTARIFQAAIKENNLLPQPITIINVGGHYSIGSRQVMEAAPDGHSFLRTRYGGPPGEAHHSRPPSRFRGAYGPLHLLNYRQGHGPRRGSNLDSGRLWLCPDS